MNIETFVNRIETYTPTGFTFWCGLRRAHYNTEKTIGNVMLMVLPASWPAMWREGCRYRINFELWLGVVVDLSRVVELTQQHNPYSPLESVAYIHQVARELIEAVSQDTYISVLNEPNMIFYDQPDGQSVNSQIWLQVPIECDVWKVAASDDVVYVINSIGQNVITNTNKSVVI